ncbi:hypothetical protein MYSTI_03610 [Myxococcus stipitatus DSM 14675]|uniref:Uncharacterized protein n=1 Tax=Myxococcus stipitatus (strain DSM 14675 / JCM 12634 / Mx s8) TaxID=1278073 RepID=L7U7R2_MYXSD|nr:hypothetical protein [Myxococcus stipitatus]AGC44916.1 hypothetical protein MYSTI_03610 [Myxococcus stipitatus DSM 14675]
MPHRKFTPDQVASAHKKFERLRSVAPPEARDNSAFFVDTQTGASLVAKERAKKVLDYPLGGIQPLSDSPIATCSFHYRYHDNEGRGALKYDPVGCSETLNAETCEELRRRRGGGSVSFTFLPLLLPIDRSLEQDPRLDRKVLTIPSVGCPRMLTDRDFVGKLVWAARAATRPTMLVVHASEAATYMKHLADILEEFQVGLVAWRCLEPVVGFGMSRLAAQTYGQLLGNRTDVVLCDVNVLDSDALPDGYDSDNEESFGVKSQQRYTGAGLGSGIARFDYLPTGQLKKTKAQPGGATRPIEQVVTVSHGMLYDPCFITSSEDADLTQRFLDKEVRAGAKASVTSVSYKWGKNRIEKVAIEARGFLCTQYMKLRDSYLRTLVHEDAILITYRKSIVVRRKKQMVNRRVTVGELATEFARELRLEQPVIRSLIIEKILLRYKAEQLGR